MKYIGHNKKNKISNEILSKINNLGIGKYDINQIINEFKKLIPIKKDDDEEIKNNEVIKNNEIISIISQEL